ncbi:MAG: thiolase family protein [Candidatus Electryonea clarkiae]|nr:thiolase family protein [Candidatus Electryonea clarkiae]MDP8286471.1 thiolase family protein [Candidatus Electryonea clarkiae]
MKNTVILSGARTPIGSFGGAFATVAAVDLGATAIINAMTKASIEPDDVDEVIMGMVLQGGVGQAPARQASKKAGIPDSKSAWTINKVCSSGLKAVMEAAGSIMLGENNVVAAGGMENMDLAPYFMKLARTGYRLGDNKIHDMMVHDGLWDPYSDQHMGNCAELCAAEHSISREEQDDFAVESYNRANESIKNGLFTEEIVPVVINSRKGDTIVNTDEEPGRGRPDKLPNLRPAFKKDGTITAGNASSINDSGAALIVADADWASSKGLKPLAEIAGWTTFSQEPEWFTTAPEKAVKKLLEKLNWNIKDVDYFELNEAFAVVSLYNNKALGLDGSNVNVRGGAVALGHPIGASGARILITLLHTLKQEGKKRGIASLCNGGGEATALAIEMV